jgi:threonine dehydratase
MNELRVPTLAEIHAARKRLSGITLNTPTVRWAGATTKDVFVKLEMLQPIGSFKLRGAWNTVTSIAPELLGNGVYTASAGNMAQGVAYSARTLGVPCTVIVPDGAPATKLAAIERLGGTVERVPFDTWWRILGEHGDGRKAFFVHPFADTNVMAGNATIALEVTESVPDVRTIIVPYGGGGLACGIAAGIRALGHGAKVVACEADTSTPLTQSLAAGMPMTVSHTRSFVDGMGGKSVFAEMWPLAHELIAGTVTVSLDQIADALRTLVERHRVVAEGAGAAPVAAAAKIDPDDCPVVCIASGGNVDTATLMTILAGRTPELPPQ